MKKFVTLCIIAIMVAMVFPLNTYALTPSDIISPDNIAEAIDPIGFDCVLIEDHSWSMENIFITASTTMFENVSNINWAKTVTFGDNGKTPLWENINSQLDNYDALVVVSDLWDTGSEELATVSNKEMILYVPFNSTYKDGVTHVESVINNIILEKWTSSTIHVLYLDGNHYKYSNVE